VGGDSNTLFELGTVGLLLQLLKLPVWGKELESPEDFEGILSERLQFSLVHTRIWLFVFLGGEISGALLVLSLYA